MIYITKGVNAGIRGSLYLIAEHHPGLAKILGERLQDHWSYGYHGDVSADAPDKGIILTLTAQTLTICDCLICRVDFLFYSAARKMSKMQIDFFRINDLEKSGVTLTFLFQYVNGM